MARINLPELPCEERVRGICGSQWRNLPDDERDGALGVAIIQSILDGLPSELGELSSHLGVPKETLRKAHKNLGMNGVFRHDRLHDDAVALNSGDVHAWGYYAGYAGGIIGTWGSGFIPADRHYGC